MVIIGVKIDDFLLCSVCVFYASVYVCVWGLSVVRQGDSGLCEQTAGSGHADVQTQRYLPPTLQRL